jgi:hypothetical protein
MIAERRNPGMKIVIAIALSIIALGGCAIDTATTMSSGGSLGPRDRTASDCRGVWDNLANACIGG